MKKYIEIKKLVKELEDEIAWWQESVEEYHDKEEIGVVKGLKRACEVINQQPTTDGWIPVSSGKLPGNNQKVLVTRDSSCDPQCNVRYTEEAYYYKEKFEYYSGWNGEGFYRKCEDYHYSKMNRVIAWQPLPPAYKESE